MITETTHEVAINKKASPYGPWLLMSYGKQGNKNIRGRSGQVGNGSSSFMERKGKDHRGSTHPNNSKDGETSDVRMGAEADGIAMSKVTVDKAQKDKEVLFEITNQKKMSRNPSHNSKKNIRKEEFPSLNPIYEKQGSASGSKDYVGRKGSASGSKDNLGSKGRKYLQKPIVQVRDNTVTDNTANSKCKVHHIEEISSGDADGCKPALPNTSKFDMVASDLVEAMAVVSE
ncbi:hypothetical protein Q3G72_012184 [Acer saccharum]|nr:hypothetical protein Q3G72_012184 [Acer saccharum]